MSERRTVKTVLQYEVDKNSTRQVVDSANTVEQAVDGINDEFTRLGPVARAAATSVRLGFSNMKKDAQQLETQLERVEDQFENVGQAARRASSSGPGGFRTSTESAGDLGSLLSAAAGLDSLGGGAASQVLGEFGQFGDVIEALGRLPSAFDDVSAALGVGKAGLVGGLGVTALAVGAVALAFSQVSAVLAESEKRAEEYRAKIAEIGDVFAQGQGSAGIQGLIAGAQSERDSLQFQRDFAQGIIDQVRAEVPDSAGGFTNDVLTNARRNDAVQRLTGGQVTTLSSFEEAVTGLNTQLDAADAKLFLFNEQLSNTDILAQDAALAETARINAYAQSRAQFSQIEADTQRFLETATIESTDARIKAANDEITRLTAVNEQLEAIGGETAAALIENNNARIDEQYAIRRTTQALRESSDTRNRLGAAFNLVEGFVGDGIRSFVDGAETVEAALTSVQPAFETVAAITRAQAESAAKLAEIARQQADAEAKAAADRDSALEEAAIDRNNALQDQEREHKQALLEINRRSNAAISNAIGDRDALAAFMAQENKRAEVAQQKRDNKEALRRIEATFKEQQRVIDKRYAEQLAAARSAAIRATEIERARLQVQVDALNQQLANQRTAAGLEIQVRDETNNAILAGAINLRNNIIELFGTQTQGGTTTGSTYTGPTNNGFTPTEDVAYFKQAGATAARKTRTTTSDSAISITIGGLGMTDAQVVREVDKRLSATLKAARQKQARAL